MFSFKLEQKNLLAARTDIEAHIKKSAYQGAETLWNELYKEVQINLSDNILNIRSGRLIGSMPYMSFIQSFNDVIIAQVGVSTPYAQFHEFGYTGTINLGSYSRNVAYKGRPYIRPGLEAIAKSVGAILQIGINNE